MNKPTQIVYKDFKNIDYWDSWTRDSPGNNFNNFKKYMDYYIDDLYLNKYSNEFLKGVDKKQIYNKLKNTTMNGFSREIVEPRGMNGFSRMNNIIDGYKLSGNEDYFLSGYELQGPRPFSKRWFRRNSPWSYIGVGVGALLVVDLATGGKIRESIGLKKKKKR